MRPINSSTRSSRLLDAFTIPEAVVAVAVIMLALGAVMQWNGQQLKMVKSARQSNAATLSLGERIEQLRIANWKQITDATYLRDTYYASQPKSMGPLDRTVEKITVTSYPDPTVTTPLIVQKTGSGTGQVLSNGAALDSERLARVDLSLAWVGTDGRDRLRESSTIITNGGISRLNIPGSGTTGGAPTNWATPGPGSGTPPSTGTGTGTGTGTSTTTGPTPTPKKKRGTVGKP